MTSELAQDQNAGDHQVGDDQRSVDQGQPGELMQAAEQRDEKADGEEHD